MPFLEDFNYNILKKAVLKLEYLSENFTTYNLKYAPSNASSKQFSKNNRYAKSMLKGIYVNIVQFIVYKIML